MDNPFADLIPGQSAASAPQAAMSNPFGDLIPQQNADTQSAMPSSSSAPQQNNTPPSNPGFLNKASAVSGVVRALEAWTAKNAGKGVGRGLLDAGQGVKQLALHAGEALGLIPKGSTSQYTKQTDASRADYNAEPGAQTYAGEKGRQAGGILPYMLLPGGIEGSVLARMGTGLLTGAGIGASQYVPEGGSRLLNTVVGGLLGTTAPLATAGVAKGANAIAGGTEKPAQQAIIQAGEKHNVPVFAADVSDNPVIQGASQMLEDVPFVGMRSARKGQMEAAQTAAQNVTGNLSDQMLNTPYGGLTGMREIEEAAQGNTPRAKTAQNLLDEMKTAGDDWNRIAQTSQNTKLFRSKLIADQKYSKVEQMANQFGNVPLENTMPAIDNAIAVAQKSIDPSKDATVGYLTKLKNNFDNRAFNYSDLRNARGQVGSLLQDYFKGSNAAVGAEGAGQIQGIKNAITRDMDIFAQKNGQQLKTVWQNADNFYRTAVAPAKDKLLAQSLTNVDPDTIYSKWIMQGDKQDRASRFYQSLDTKGRAAIRYGMANQALEAAQKPGGMFSPNQFASQLEKISGARGVFFKGQDRAEMDGFTNLMRGVGRSFQVLNKPETGVKTIPYLITAILGYGAHAVGAGTGTLAAGAAGTAALKLLMTTTAGRRLLLSSSKLQADSPAMQTMINNASKLLQRSAVVKGVNALPIASQTPTQ